MAPKMAPKASETTRVTKANQRQEGDALVRNVNTETTQRRGGTVVKKVDSDLTTKTETSAKRVAAPLSKSFFRTLIGTLETERRALPADPKLFNAKASEFYEELRTAINKASKTMTGDAEWKGAVHALIDDSKRRRAGDAAMQLHGPARQIRQRKSWEATLEQAFALLRRAA